MGYGNATQNGWLFGIVPVHYNTAITFDDITVNINEYNNSLIEVCECMSVCMVVKMAVCVVSWRDCWSIVICQIAGFY